jgi:putative transposase
VDVHKQTKGRKRHIAVDKLGMLLAIVAHSADIQDRDGGKLVVMRLRTVLPDILLLFADGGYAGKFVDWVAAFAGWAVSVVKRSDENKVPSEQGNAETKGFVVLKKRWIVERTFAWLTKFRRLVRDYAETIQSSEAWVRIAMIHIMARRLAPLRS